MAQHYALKTGVIGVDPNGDYVLAGDYEKLRLLLAEVIIRFSAFDGDFMNRLLSSIEEKPNG